MFSCLLCLALVCGVAAVDDEHLTECRTPKGMHSGHITDNNLKVSSSAANRTKEKARYGCCEDECNAAWCPDSNDKSPYYEVHFDKPTTVASISFMHPTSANQACHFYATAYMKKFRLLFTPVIGTEEFVEFNHDIDAIYNKSLSYTVGFIPTFVTQTIRIEPEESHIAPCFKFEVFGCEPSALCPKDFCDHEGTCIGTNQCQCKDRFFGDKCQYTDQQILQKTYSFLFTKIVQNILFTTSFNMTTTGHVEIETVGTQNLIVLREGGAAQVDIESGHVDSCLKDLDTCASGFTYSLTLNIEKMTSQKIYLLSNDAFEDNNRGLWLVYEGSKLSCHVATSERIWNLDVTTAIALSTWYKIEVSWNKNLGLQLLLNDKVIGTKVQSFEKTHVATKTKALSIGSALNTGVVIRVFELKLVPLVRSEVSRANITTETLPPALMPIPTETVCKTPLGMENRSILSKQLTVSSSADGHNKDDARYGPPEGTAGKAWCPKETTGSFFEVTFNKPTAIGGLHFQHPQMAKNSFPTDYMKTFRLLFKNSYSNESRLTEFSQNIPALYNATTAFTISFTPIIVTDVIRFEPETWESAPCFRFELFGCDPSFLCKSDFCENGGSCIGENLCICTAGFYGYDCSVTHVTVTTYTFLHIISNMVITATQNFSIHGDVTIDTKTSLLTLSSTAFIEMAKPGHCLTNLDTCFSGFTFSLTVNFLQLTTNKFYLMTSGGDQDGVKGIALYYQAKQLYCYVTTSSKRWLLVVPYVLETTHWYRFHISWNPNLGLQLFENKTLIGSVFTVAGVYIHASKVQNLYIGNQITIQNSLVMVIQKFETANQVFKEIEKSRVKEASLPPTLPPFNSMSTVPATGPMDTEAPTEARPAATTSTTGTTAATTAVCETLLGMSSGAITDDQLSVSSSSPDHDQQKLRLDCCENEQLGSWCAAENDTKPWVEINLKTAQAISQILFQHPAEMTVPASAFVRFVNIYYNNLLSNNSQLELYSRHVRAMYNDTLAYHVKLEPAVVTDTLRLVITDYVNQPCMRLELVGCESQVLCGPGFCKNGGVCAGEHVCLCSTEFYGHMCQFKRPDIPQFKYEIIDKVNNIVTTTHGNLTVHEIVSVKPIRSHHVLVLGKQGYVEVPLTHSCIQDLDNCRTGFTYSINTNFQTIGTEMPILATGKGDSGVLLIYRDGKMLCTVGTSKAMWIVSAVIVLEVKTWYQIDLSWSMFHGLHLYIDGVKIAGTVASGVNHHGFTKHPLCIGYGYTPITGLEHFEFWVRQLQIFYTYRHDLIKADILEKYQHPQTTSIPTTTIKPSVCNSTMTDITFTTINGTDLLTSLNTMKVHGAASLEQAKEGTLLVLDGPGQYVDLQETGIPCLDDITTCNTSFNFRLTFQFITIDVNSNYIISSGGNIVDSSGIALYYWNGQLNFWVKNSLTIGKSRYYVNITAGVWYTLDATWDKETGNTSMYLNGKTLQNRPLPNIPAPSSTKTHTLLIGKSPDKDHTSHIKLLLFRLWTESHNELIQNNCTKAIEMPVFPTPTSVAMMTTTLSNVNEKSPSTRGISTASTLLKTASPSVTNSPYSHHQFTFTKIVGNVVLTPEYTLTKHGDVALKTHGNESVLSITGISQWVEIGADKLGCFSDLKNCHNGITSQVEARVLNMTVDTTIYFLLSGNITTTSPFVLYYQEEKLHAKVQVGINLWEVSANFHIIFGQRYTYQVVWNVEKGLQLVVDNILLVETKKSTTTSIDVTSTQVAVIGKVPTSTHIDLEISQIHFWNERKEYTTKSTPEVATMTTTLPNVNEKSPSTIGISTASTLSKTASPSVTNSPYSHHQFTFTKIVGNVVLTPEYTLTKHGDVTLKTHGNESVLSITGISQWVEIGADKLGCFSDLKNCHNGITSQVEARVLNMTVDTTIYFLLSGNITTTSPFVLYYQEEKLHAKVQVGINLWEVSANFHIIFGQRYTYQVVWNVEKGLQLVVDNILLVETKKSTTTSIDVTSTQVAVIGKVPTSTHIDLEISQIHFWNERKEYTTKSTPEVATMTTTLPNVNEKSPSTIGISTASTLSKTASPSVTNSPYSHHQFTFTKIVGNVVLTPEYTLTKHGDVALKTHGNESVLSITGISQWVEIGADKLGCFSDLKNCHNGITSQVEARVLNMTVDTTIYFLLSGNITTTSPFVLYYQEEKLHAKVQVGINLWEVSANFHIIFGQRYTYQVVWNVEKGLQLVVDNILLVETKKSTTTSIDVTSTQVAVIGKVPTSTHIDLEISQIHFWNERKEYTTKSTPEVATMTTTLPNVNEKSPSTIGISTASTLSKTASPSVTNSPYSHHQFTFTKIVGNVVLTPEYTLTKHGDVALKTHGNESVLSITGISQWVEIGADKLGCFSDLKNCHNGITSQVEARVLNMTVDTTIYFLLSGNITTTSPFVLYYQEEKLHAKVQVGINLWEVSANFHIIFGQRYTYQVVWNVEKGLQLVVDNILLVETKKSTTTSIDVTSTQVAVIGKVPTSTHIDLEISQIHFWNERKEYTTKSTPEVATMTTTLPNVNEKSPSTIGISTASTLSKTASPSVTNSPYSHHQFTFTKIVGNVVLTPEYTLTKHGDVALKTHGNESVLSITGISQWVEIGADKLGCFSDLKNCHNGITSQVEARVLNMTVDTTIYFLLSGNITTTSPFVLYYQEEKLHAKVQVGTNLWEVSANFHIIFGQRYTYQVVWNVETGLQLVVDNILLVETKKSTTTSIDVTSTQVAVIGKVPTSTHIDLEISQIHFWNERKEYTTMTTPAGLTISTPYTTPSQKEKVISTNLSFKTIQGSTLVTDTVNMTVGGNPKLITDHNVTYLKLHGINQWLEIPQQNVPCASTPSRCHSGFTFQVGIMSHMIASAKKITLISNGNDTSSSISMYYEANILYVSIHSGQNKWIVTVPYTMSINKLNTYQISWSSKEGLKLYVNNILLGIQKVPVIVSSTQGVNQNIHIGKTEGSFFVTNIQIWKATRSVLAQRGILPTPVETCNGTPIHSGKTMIDLSFQSIENDLLETTDLTIRANGNPVITKQNDSSSLDLSQPGQYIEIDTECLPCLSDLPQCSSGFTIQLVVTFSEIDIKSRKYIICTDQYQPGQSGVCLFYEMGRLKGNVATGAQKWPINFSYEIEFHVPYTFQISWSRLTGYQLYINEYTMPPTQALPLLQNATKTSMSFWVGKSPKSNATTPMVVANFKIYLATREVLVQRGILQPVLTTPPTTTLTPPTPPSLPEFEWHFENITSTFIMSSYLNLTIHGHPKGDKSGIHFSHSNQYLEIANIPKTCLTDLTYCRNGLTIVLEMIFNLIEENTVILTTGAEKPDLPGISVVYRYGHFHFICSSTTEAWFVSVPREHIQIGVSHVLYISWKHTLKIYVDKVLITAAKEHITHPRPSHELKDVFYFGKSFTSSSTVRPLQCVIKTLHIWYKYIDELEKAGELLIDERTTYMPIATSTSIPGTCPMGCVPILETSTKLEPTTLPTTEVAEIKTQPPTPTPTTTPAMTTIDPGVPTFSVTLTLTPVVDMTGTYLTCTLSLYQTKNVEIQFQWYIDEIEQVTKTVTTPLLQGRLYVSEIKGVKDTLYDKEIFCTAKAKYTIGREWTSVIQSATFRPAITPLTSTRATITMTEGQHPSHIEVKTNCPPQMFCKLTDKGKCNVDVIATVVNNHHESKCTRDIILPQIVVQKDGTASAVCGKSMTSSNWHESIKIPIKATIDGLHDDDQHRDVHIKLKTTGLEVKESLMKTIAAYKVTAKDTDGHRYSTCASLNDPHITTFDGNHYNNYQHGEYVLYKHKTLPYEVRTRYQTCSSRNPRGPTCNCAVAIKSGDDVITLTGCHGTTGHPSIFNRFFHRSRTPPITVEMYKNGDLTPGTTVRRVGCGQQYEIRLPTGTLITVKSSYLSFINVWVRASAVDYQQTLGLCGSFNRNKRDDLYGSDHKTYPISRQPDHFSQTWHISEIQTMFHGVSTVTTSTDTFCSCMDGARPICQPNLDIFRCSTATLRDDITATLVRQAKTPTPTLRRTKRAAPIEDKPFMEDDPQTKYTNSSARQACKDFIDNKSATKTCASYVNVTDELLQECADDLVATGDKEWAQSHLDHIVIECIGEAVRNAGMYRGDNSTIFDRIPDDIMTALCPEQCQHGKCREGSCVCYDGYTGPTCNVDKNSKPEILPVTEDGLGCNADGDDSCSEISIMGFDFVESDSLTCFYQLIDVAAHVSGNGQWIPTPATYLSTYQVVCSLPHPQSARVAVSNDGQTLSERSYLHVVYDDCHTCEINDDGTDASCSRKADTCLIGESCYKNGDKMSGSECAVCDPTANMGNWTLNTDPLCSATKLTSSPQSQDEEVAASTIALGVIVAVLAVVIVAGVVIYCKKRPANMKRKLVEEGEYNFTSPQSRLSSMPRPNMRDISFSNTVYDGTAESLKAPEMTETH